MDLVATWWGERSEPPAVKFGPKFSGRGSLMDPPTPQG